MSNKLILRCSRENYETPLCTRDISVVIEHIAGRLFNTRLNLNLSRTFSYDETKIVHEFVSIDQCKECLHGLLCAVNKCNPRKYSFIKFPKQDA